MTRMLQHAHGANSCKQVLTHTEADHNIWHHDDVRQKNDAQRTALDPYGLASTDGNFEICFGSFGSNG